MYTNFLLGLTTTQDIQDQVAAEVSRLKSRDPLSERGYQAPVLELQSPVLEISSSIFQLPRKPIAVPGKYTTTTPNLTSPHPVFSENQSTLTCLELHKEHPPYVSSDPILSPAATTRNSSISSQEMGSPSPVTPGGSPKSPPIIKINVRKSRYSKEFPLVESQRATELRQREVKRERELAEEAEKLRLQEEEEDRRYQAQLEADPPYEEDEEIPNGTGPSVPIETITALRVNYTSSNNGFEWLGQIYGCRVYCSEMSSEYLNDTYVTQPLIICSGPLARGVRIIYLHPLPITHHSGISSMINSVYVMEPEITKAPPARYVIPKNPKQPVFNKNDRPYIMMCTELQQKEFKIELTLESTEQLTTVSEPTENKTQLTEAAVAQIERAYRQGRDLPVPKTGDDDTKSVTTVGSTGTKFSMKEEIVDSINQWMTDNYTIDINSKQVTDINVLYANYKGHKTFAWIAPKTFASYMKRMTLGLWKQTTNKDRKRIIGYRGFNLRQ